jgi:fibronectin-binding autotransporter adhesin
MTALTASQSWTVADGATLTIGSSTGDYVLFGASGNTLTLNNGTGVIASAGRPSFTGGMTVRLAGGSISTLRWDIGYVGSAAMTIDGGTLTATGAIRLAYGGTGNYASAGTVTQNGGVVTTPTLYLANNSAASPQYSDYYLNGGTLNLSTVGNGYPIRGGNTENINTAYGRLYFNSGTLNFTCASAATVSTPICYVQNGGANIGVTAAGVNVMLNCKLREDAGSTGGGLVKSGAGSLTIGGITTGTAADCTYTGLTYVKEGTLALGTKGSILNSSGVKIAGGATFYVAAYTSGWSLGSAQTLSGNGTLTGVLSAGGAVSPGESIGTLHQNGNCTLSGSLVAEIGTILSTGAPVSDLLAGTGTLAVSSADLVLSTTTTGAADGLGAEAVGTAVSSSAATFTANEVTFWYCLATNDGTDAISGVFTKLNGAETTLAEGSIFQWNGLNWMITYQANYDGATKSFTGGNDIAIGTAVPEPGTLALAAAGLLGLIAYAWRKRK